MPASEIVRIAVTVGIVQLVCDLVAHWRIFSQPLYQRSLERLSRAQFKVNQLQQKEILQQQANNAANNNKNNTNSKHQDRQSKSLQRAIDDQADALANVAQRHTVPSVLTSLTFVILMRILGTECAGKIMALLPFVPYTFFTRITARGLTFDESNIAFDVLQGVKDGEATQAILPHIASIHQAASFTLVYLLAAASIKYYLHLLIATPPPKGAESLMALVDSPSGHKVLKAAGIDPKDLKVE